MKTDLEGGYLVSDKTGNGVPVLFIHGYPLSRRIWDPQKNELSKYATVITIDLRGHGESFPFDGAYSMDLLADDCKFILEAEQVNAPLVICGLSMGGYITFAMYRKYPHLFKGMILTSTRAGADSLEGKTNRDAAIKLATDRGVDAIANNMINKIVSPLTISSNPGLVKTIHDIMANTSTLGVIGALQGMRDRPDSTSLLSQIKCPVLIIHGEDDQLIPIKDAESMHHLMPGSKMVKVPRAGHLPNMEQAREFNRIIQNFLSDIC